MRKLKTTDVFSFCRVVKVLGIKEALQQIAKEADNAKDIWDKGFDLLWAVFDIATEKNGERQLCDFFAGPFEMTAEEVENLDLDVLIEKVKQLAEENDLAGFFKSAAKVMKSK